MGLRAVFLRSVLDLQADAVSFLSVLPEGSISVLAKMLSADNKLVNADSHMKVILAVNNLLGTPLISKNPVESRQIFERQMQAMKGERISLEKIVDFEMRLDANQSIAARHYHPTPENPLKTQDKKQPLILFLHGGGFTIGSINTHDEFCRYLSHFSQMQVLSIDYRLAPEHPAPAAIHDSINALKWIYEHADELNIDNQRIFIAGDSAGGNLATVVCQQTKHEVYAPKAQLLIYPVTDVGKTYPSYRQFGSGSIITFQDKSNFEYFYIHKSNIKMNDPLVAPIHGDVTDIAPAYVVTAEIDLFVDEGEAYAHKLRKAKVTTYSERMLGQPHGFINMVGIHPQAKIATIKLAKGFAHFTQSLCQAQKIVYQYS